MGATNARSYARYFLPVIIRADLSLFAWRKTQAWQWWNRLRLTHGDETLLGSMSFDGVADQQPRTYAPESKAGDDLRLAPPKKLGVSIRKCPRPQEMEAY